MGAEEAGTGGGGEGVAAVAEGIAVLEVTAFNHRVYVLHAVLSSSRLKETKRLRWRAMLSLIAS